MQQNPSPWQYLLDIIAKARLEAAKTNNDPEQKAKQIKNYTDLKETECVFSTPVSNKDANGRRFVDISVPGRGFKLQNVAYKTGTVLAMSKPKANIMLNASTLDVSNTTGLYYVEQTGQLHLLVHPQSNLWEALQMTGYVFTPKQFSTEQYDVRNNDLKADGHIDIKDSVVAGRIYVSFIQREVKKDPLAGLKEELKESDVVDPSGTSNLSLPVEGGEPLETLAELKEPVIPVADTKPELTEEEQIQHLLDADAEKAKLEAAAEETTPGETQEEPVADQQNLKSKKK